MEREARQSKGQLEELTRTATDYASMLQRKESEINQLLSDLDALHREREVALKHASEFQTQVSALEEQLQAQTADRQRDSASRSKLQKELDDLRNIMAAKASEDTRRNEVHRSKEKELVALRAHAAKLAEELDEFRRTTTESQARLKMELEEANHARSSIEQAHKELVANQTENVKRREAAEATLSEVQRSSRALESELQLLRGRSVKMESDLAETTKAKEVRLLSFFYPLNLTVIA